MSSARDIRRRIRSIGTTSQITRAMQMVAASKMRKAQQAAIQVRPFIRMLYHIQRIATTKVAQFTHPLTEMRPVRKRAIVLVASDKGLCGALNSNLFRDLFLKGDVDEVRIIASQFVNTLTQRPVSVEFLPIGDVTGIEVPGVPKRAEIVADRTEYLFEPNEQDLISYMLPVFLNVLMHGVLLNAKASEQSARMVSMSSATDNAAEMIKDLTLEYNKLRQGKITQE